MPSGRNFVVVDGWETYGGFVADPPGLLVRRKIDGLLFSVVDGGGGGGGGGGGNALEFVCTSGNANDVSRELSLNFF